MTRHAMPISISAKTALAGAALAVLLSSPLAAQTRSEDPDAMDVARTPLRYFNIKRDDIPPILIAAVDNPYEDEGLIECDDLITEVAALDTVLGDDFDLPQEEGRRISAGRVAQTVVGSFIPFRGLVREVSGANKKRNELRLAVTAGMVRRGYLKGLGEQRGCPYPARPRQINGVVEVERSSNAADRDGE